MTPTPLLPALLICACAGSALAQARIMSIGSLPGAEESSAGDVSADGRVVVGLSALVNGCCRHAVRWTFANGLEDLGSVPGTTIPFPNYLPLSVNSDGSVIVGLQWA